MFDVLSANAQTSSLRAQRSNPEAAREELDCFVAALLAMTETVAAPLPGLTRQSIPLRKTFLIDGYAGQARV
jgi:hypothetical protein